jgi:branched-chain amino acid aminotransferase
VFVTSSIREVLPIVAVDGRAIANGTVGPLTRALHADLRAQAGVAHLPMPWE